MVKSNQKNPLDQHSTDGVRSESTGKRSRTEGDSETPTSEPQGGSSTRPEGVKKAKARMTGKMVADQSIQALSTFGESLRLNSEIMKEKTELQKQKEARKQKQLQMEEYRMNWDIYQTLSKKETLQPWEADMMVQLGQYFQNYNRQKMV